MDEKTITILKRLSSTNPKFSEIYKVYLNRETVHTDVVSTDGQIFLDVRRDDYDHLSSPDFHIPAEWFWCFSQIENNEDVEIADQSLIDQIPKEVLSRILSDVDLAPVTFFRIKKINYFEMRKKVIRKSKPALKNVAFFKWAYGLGVCVTNN